MSEESFSWFKRSRKRKINPLQSPLDFLNLPNLELSDLELSDLVVLLENWAEQESLTPRTLIPGTYKADDLTLMIDERLPSHVFDLVLGHEYAHALLSDHHYGAVIVGLETFATQVAAALALIREYILMEIFAEELQGTHYKSKSSSKLSFEFIKRVGLDKLMNQRICERLASDQIFMRGLRFLDDVDRRKNLLLRHWKRAQEGGAYWLSLYAYEQELIEHDDSYKREGTELIRTTRATLLQIEDENGEGFRMVKSIAEAWGDDWVAPVLVVCMSPDITQLSILHAPLANISQNLSTTTRFSPDRRLEAIYQMAVSHSFMPKEPNDVGKLVELLDPDNSTPDLSVDRFNVYWNRLEADAEFGSLMNDLLQRLGLERDYKPIQVPEGKEFANMSITILGHKGQILQGDDLEVKDQSDLLLNPVLRKLSITKDLLLRTMRAEGLV